MIMTLEIMDNPCVILAGGLGTRLSSVLHGVPKCLAPIGDSTFLECQMRHLCKLGVTSFVLSLGHNAKMVIDYVGSLQNEYDVSYVVEDKPLLTGGAIKLALLGSNLSEALVINGDTIVSGDLSEMLKPLTGGFRCTMGLCKVSDRSRYGGVEIDDSFVTSFGEKKSASEGLINAGIYRVNQEAFSEISADKFSFELEVLPRLASMRLLCGRVLNGSFIDIGVPDDYKRLCQNRGRYFE
tara:strand:- start:5458 stop:6174 length:717 start_codon:yes stop_codon:yes gene_type:complete